jgi:hypothetical protein
MIQSLIIAQVTIVFHGLNLKIQLMKIQLIRLIFINRFRRIYNTIY